MRGLTPAENRWTKRMAGTCLCRLDAFCRKLKQFDLNESHALGISPNRPAPTTVGSCLDCRLQPAWPAFAVHDPNACAKAKEGDP